MDMNFLTPLGSTIWLPVLIFFARIFDVTMGTIRIIFISRGKKNLAPILGFVETFIWIVVVSQIVRTIYGIWSYVGYAAGFAAGTLVGMYVEEHLAIGTLIVRTILPGQVSELISRLCDAGFGVTSFPAAGGHGPVTVIYTVIKRRDLNQVVSIIHSDHPHAFLSIEQVASSREGIFPPSPVPGYRQAFIKRK